MGGKSALGGLGGLGGPLTQGIQGLITESVQPIGAQGQSGQENAIWQMSAAEQQAFDPCGYLQAALTIPGARIPYGAVQGEPVSTLYQCGDCNAIVNTVWDYSGKKLCRQCFGRARGFDSSSYSTGLNERHSTIRLVKSDGTVQDLDLKGVLGPKPPANDGPARKFRFPEETEE